MTRHPLLPLALLILTAACARSTSGGRTVPASTPLAAKAPVESREPVGAPVPPAAVRPAQARVEASRALRQARDAREDGDIATALRLFERVAAGGAAPAALRLEAAEAAAILRLSPGGRTRDLERARVHLETLRGTSPEREIALSVRDLAALVTEAVEARAQARKAAQDLRAAELEIAKKDEALRRVTQSVVGRP